MKKETALLKEANEIMRSIMSVIDREGNNTDWEGLKLTVGKALEEQHTFLNKGINLEDLEKKLDSQLGRETRETLSEWIKTIREE